MLVVVVIVAIVVVVQIQLILRRGHMSFTTGTKGKSVTRSTVQGGINRVFLVINHALGGWHLLD